MHLYENEKRMINEMRVEGKTPTEIAVELKRPVSTIRSYILRNPEPDGYKICRYCGKFIKQIKGQKPRQFCGTVCRNAYWNRKYREDKQNGKGKYSV